MELRKFISDALCEIIGGIKDTQDKTNETGALINPTYSHDFGNGHKRHYNLAESITFDIAVTANNKSDGGFGINVFGSSIGSKLNEEKSNISRINFQIKVVFPPDRSEKP